MPASHDLTTFLAAAPEGWSRTAYAEADGQAVTGRDYQRMPLPSSDTEGVLGILAKTRATGRVITETYAKGDAKVIAHISYRAPRTNKTFNGKIDDRVTGRLERFRLLDPVPPFGTVQGVTFRQRPMTDRDLTTDETFELTYRRLDADLGRAMDILVVTDADDAAVQAILTGLDLPGLAALAGLQQVWCAPISPSSGAKFRGLPWMRPRSCKKACTPGRSRSDPRSPWQGLYTPRRRSDLRLSHRPAAAARHR